jgi:hypothetical protein
LEVVEPEKLSWRESLIIPALALSFLSLPFLLGLGIGFLVPKDALLAPPSSMPMPTPLGVEARPDSLAAK